MENNDLIIWIGLVALVALIAVAVWKRWISPIGLAVCGLVSLVGFAVLMIQTASTNAEFGTDFSSPLGVWMLLFIGIGLILLSIWLKMKKHKDHEALHDTV